MPRALPRIFAEGIVPILAEGIAPILAEGIAPIFAEGHTGGLASARGYSRVSSITSVPLGGLNAKRSSARVALGLM